jgi:predicted nucleic acid-binding protein
LRASDALHLALVEESGGILMTLDHRLASAAAALGVKAQLL